jgi:hypothetical protein
MSAKPSGCSGSRSRADGDHLHDRLATGRWPGELPGVERTRGVPLDT